MADEVMVTTNVYDHDERLRSDELLADVFKIATPGGKSSPNVVHDKVERW